MGRIIQSRRRPERRRVRGSRPSITVSMLGAGNVGNVLARALDSAGVPVVEVISRPNVASLRNARRLAKQVGASVVEMPHPALSGNVILLCIPDDAIGKAAQQLAKSKGWKGKYVLHTSGALSSQELLPLRKAGANVGSMHPMNSFAPAVKTKLEGTVFAVEGDRQSVMMAKILAEALKCPAFEIAVKDKPLYHAMGSFFAPLLVSLLEAGERVGKTAGVKEPRAVVARMLQATTRNYLESGASAAFSGPMRRGDLQTIARHLKELRRIPGAKAIYVALARNIAEHLPVKKRSQLKKLLT